MGELERKPGPQRKPARSLFGYLHRTDIPLAAVVLLAVFALHHWMFPANTTLIIVVKVILGIVLLPTMVAAIAYTRRTRAAWETLQEIRRENPPPSHGDDLWMHDLLELAHTFNVLNQTQHDRLRTAYDSVWSSGHDSLWDAVEGLAAELGRLTPAVQAELARLNAIPCGAAPAVLALVTRDRISAAAFHTLTEAWVSAKLPLPGGDVPDTWHVRMYVLAPDADQETGWDLAMAENIPADSGEAAAQVLSGTARNLPAHVTAVRWKLKIWAGPHNGDQDPTTAAAAEFGQPPALQARQQEAIQ